MSTNQPRVKPGIPTGGQWSSQEHAEGVLTLDSDFANDRLSAMRNEGYVKAVVTSAAIDPASRKNRAEWWQSEFVTAEYGHGSGDYRQMPDDFTPSKLAGNELPGQALSGARRTHRMCYSGAGVKVRMPSATSIKKFEKTASGNTFDVPVSASYEGGTAQGWVRVTRNGDRWDAKGLGFSDDADIQVAEAVSAVLESRQPSLALNRVSDLAERRKARIEQAGTPLQPVNSEWIEGVAYDDDSGTMYVGMEAGSVYGYRTNRDTYEYVKDASSPGRAYNRYVKGGDRAAAFRCDKCARFASADKAHVCPASDTYRTGDRFTQNATAQDAAESILSGMAARQITPNPSGAPPAPGGGTAGPVINPEPESVPNPTPAIPYGSHTSSTQDYDLDLSADLKNRGRRPVMDCTDGTGSLYGRRGWTTSVAPALGKFTGSTYVPWAYQLDDDGQPTATNGQVGIIRYEGADSTSAASVYAGIPPAGRDENQNEGPKVSNVLAAVSANPGRYEYGGYVVGPDRTDERVSIDSVAVFANVDESQRQNVLNELKTSFGGEEPDSLDIKDIPWRPGEKAWVAWWD